MIVDSSAFLTVLFDEPGHEPFSTALGTATGLTMSAASYLEIFLRVDRLGSSMIERAERLLSGLAIEVVAFTADQAIIARDANRLFGKANHSAGLNFGDCMSYALATVAGEPLLYRGDDFSQTDIPSAL